MKPAYFIGKPRTEGCHKNDHRNACEPHIPGLVADVLKQNTMDKKAQPGFDIHDKYGRGCSHFFIEIEIQDDQAERKHIDTGTKQG